MELKDKIDLYLKESKLLDDNDKEDKDALTELFDISGDAALSNIDAMSFSTGLRRISILFSKANTPRRYAIAFEIANDMVQKFPLKAKFVLSAVADAYQKRFGAITSGE